MRWVDRGPEPAQVEDYRQRYTQDWVNHYRDRMGERGPDLVGHWRDFRGELSNRFFGKCGYCEMLCGGVQDTNKAPTVDHFRPISRFPELAYEWANWLLACVRCNQRKANLWPESGYIDPCAIPVEERPESYLDVDDRTGEVIAKSGLTQAARAKAQNTIEDIGLNALDVLYFRIQRVRDLTAAIDALPATERQAFLDFATRPELEFAGVSGMVAAHLRRTGEL